MPFAAHPKVSYEVRERVKTALRSLSDTPEGIARLSKLNFKGIEIATDDKWDDVRALDITTLSELAQ